MLLQDIQAHKLFTGFKGKKLELDLLICYPHGTGGNFIWDVVTNGFSDGAVDEMRFDGIWMKLDHVPLARVETDLATHFDILCSVAETMTPTFDPGEKRTARTHFPPVITDLVFDFKCEEMAFMEVRYEDKWFPTALSLIRNHLLTPWDGNPHLIELLLNHCIISGIGQRVMVTDYLSMLDTLSSHTDGIPWTNSLLSWDYFIHCKQNGYAYGRESLSHFLTTWIFRPDAYAYYSTDAYRDTRDSFKDKVLNHNVMDYADVFFDLRLPEKGNLSSMDVNHLKVYSRSTLETVNGISALLDDRYLGMVRDRISTWGSKIG